MTEPNFSQFIATDADVNLEDARDVVDFMEETDAPGAIYDTPDSKFIHEERQSRKAKEYETKTLKLLNSAMRVTADDPRTVADAAILILKGKPFAAAMGTLAEEDKRAAKMVDFFTEGTSNPYAAVFAAAAPILLQVVRNHEPVLEPQHRGFHIPFTKRTIKFRFGIKLGKIRALTHEPRVVESWVFDNPEVKARMEKLEITVARTNGRKSRD